METNEEDIGALMKRSSDDLKAYADATLKKRGITFSQARALVFFQEHGGEAMQKDLEEYLHISHPTAVGIVTRLEKKGFVQSFIREDSHRKKIVRITEKARELSEEMERKKSDLEKIILSGFRQDEIELMKEFLVRICKNIGKVAYEIGAGETEG